MAKYKKRKDGRYPAQIKIGYQDNGKPKYKTLYGRTIAELDQKVVEFKANLNKGIIIDDKKLTLGDWAEKWLKIYKKSVSYNTKQMYKNIVERYICGVYEEKTRPYTTIKNIPLKNLTSTDLQVLVDELLANSKTKTVTNFKQTLIQILDRAIENDFIYKNVARELAIPRFPKKQKRAMHDFEIEAFKKADLTQKERAFFSLCYYAGLRRGEALALSRDDIKFQKSIDESTTGEDCIIVNKALIFVNNQPEIKDVPKTEGSIRNIPIPNQLKLILHDYLKTINGPYLFSSQNSHLMTETSYQNMWAGIIKKMDNVSEEPVQGLTAHILRHTYATKLYYGGVDIKTAQYLMGHSDIKVTLEIYTSLKIDNNETASKITDIFADKNNSESVKNQSNDNMD